MGMRGIIALEQGKSTYKVTTVQWLTDADASWGKFVEGMDYGKKMEVAKKFAESIVKYSHISYFSYAEGERDLNAPEYMREGEILVKDGDRRLVTSELVFEEGGAHIYRGDIVTHPHFQDGQAMVIQKDGRVIIMEPRF